MTEINKPRLIAYYLPQYHPIPENDTWWGDGFTEWTNVTKALPLFKEHYQPHIPTDLAYYDLRNPEAREAQAQLARQAGIEGFCYWHYWFAGKRLLERPLNEVLQSGKPDFPFCLGWANQSWTGIWHGQPERILIEQTYPGDDDHRAHFNALLPAFSDSRYMQVDGRPIFLVFQPSDLTPRAVELWRALAHSAGLAGLYLVGVVKNAQEAAVISQAGFDACTISRTAGRGRNLPITQRVISKVLGARKAPAFYQKMFNRPFHVYQSRDLLPYIEIGDAHGLDFFPCVMPGWDNTSRTGLNGVVWMNPSPGLFGEHLRQAIKRVEKSPPESQIIIVKSWNEWAEGNYLEPERRFGHGYLEAIRDVIQESSSKHAAND